MTALIYIYYNVTAYNVLCIEYHNLAHNLTQNSVYNTAHNLAQNPAYNLTQNSVYNLAHNTACLSLFQGYHDICVTFLLVVGEDLTFAIMNKLSEAHLRCADISC